MLPMTGSSHQQRKISIIVPIFNSAAYLSQCIDSLLVQTYNNIEIICVDDGSTDSSYEILQRYASQDNRIRIVHQTNGGVSKARNSGLDIMTGFYHMFVDSDDWVEKDICMIMYTTAEQNKADCVMCSYTKEFGDYAIVNRIFENEFVLWHGSQVKHGVLRKLFGLLGEELAHPENADLLVSPCMQLFRSEKFGEIRFYDINKTGTFEDGLYQIEVYRNCECFCYVDKPLYRYRRTNSKSITSKYKPYLFHQWQHVFDLLEETLATSEDPAFQMALNNRVCLSMIGLGLNELLSRDRLSEIAQRLKEMLSANRYLIAFSNLCFKWFPLHWKLFFILCKQKKTVLLVILLRGIEILRTRTRFRA